MIRCAVILLCLALVGCATHDTPFHSATPATSAMAQDKPFSVSGKLSVNMDGKGYFAGFDWDHSPDHDLLSVNTPLGNTVARVEKTRNGVTLTSGSKTVSADSAEQLTREQLGWPLPLDNLIWWIRGMPAPSEPYQQQDGALLQQGWKIRFVSAEGSRSLYPDRVELSRDNLAIKVVAQQWH